MDLLDRVRTKATYVAHDLRYSAQFIQSGSSLLANMRKPGATLLRPGGLLIATTRSREHIFQAAEISRLQDIRPNQQGVARSFANPEEALAAYDRGEFYYSPSGGCDILDGPFYGEAVVPRAFVENHWTKHVRVLDFIADRTQLVQNVIVARKDRSCLKWLSRTSAAQ